MTDAIAVAVRMAARAMGRAGLVHATGIARHAQIRRIFWFARHGQWGW